MTKAEAEPSVLPRNLQVARESLNVLDRVEILREFEWNPDVRRWTLLIRMNIADGAGGVPARSAWYVLTEAVYPWGAVKIYPANRDGLETTHHHQNLNLPGGERLPWRTGNICVDTGVHALGPVLDTEPYDADLRLQWHVRRACEWLEAADRGRLIVPGEPFELPDFGPPPSPIVAFWEDQESFAQWAQVEEDRGLVRLTRLRDRPEVAVVRAFQDNRRNDLVVPQWGDWITAATGRDAVGLWVRLPDVPHLPPWRAPVTWSDLRDALQPHGVTIPDDLRDLLPAVRDAGQHYLLLGFPIPNIRGGEQAILYWLPLQLPRLARGKRDGFRDGEQAAWLNDRMSTFRLDRNVPWVRSENWSPSDLSGRGRLPAEVVRLRFVIIGGGALGSYVAELLVRAGVSELSLSEDDQIRAGNLVRHTATLTDVGSDKGPSVASRLNAASPHAKVTAIGSFPPDKAEEVGVIEAADVVIDLTGDQALPAALGAYDWGGEKLFFSISLGLHAQRLFCFSAAGNAFPHEEFVDRMQPWLRAQIAEAQGMEVPREGIGCWHPVFPARVDDVWLLGAAAVKWIEQRIQDPPTEPELIVFEQMRDADGFSGIRRCQDPPDRG